MNLEGVLSITGKPGLYKVIGQTKGGVVVESLSDKKRVAVPPTARMSALEDIAIYTYSGEVPIKEVFATIWNKEDGGLAINHKSKPDELRVYFEGVLEDFDQERVYTSDIKKLISWYNLLHAAGFTVEKVAASEEKKAE